MLRRRLAAQEESGFDEFFLAYQPIVDLDAKGNALISGFEALARWGSPTVSPTLFIGLLEEDPVRLCRFSEHMLRQALQFQSQVALPVNFNVSPRQFLGDPDFLEELLLGHHERHRIEIEITESPIDGSAKDFFIEELRHLHDHGVRLAIDDFGSAHASFSRLLDIPVDTIKIERHIVSNLPHARASAIIESVLLLADRVGARVVAEGIETSAQRDFLHRLGVRTMQGFFFSPPLPGGRILAGDLQLDGIGEKPVETGMNEKDLGETRRVDPVHRK